MISITAIELVVLAFAIHTLLVVGWVAPSVSSSPPSLESNDSNYGFQKMRANPHLAHRNPMSFLDAALRNTIPTTKTTETESRENIKATLTTTRRPVAVEQGAYASIPTKYNTTNVKVQQRSLSSRRQFGHLMTWQITGVGTALLVGNEDMEVMSKFYPPASLFSSVASAAPMVQGLPEEGEIAEAIPKDWKDIENPFRGEQQKKLMFNRLDSTSDSKFYSEPRFVEHVDEQAVKTLTSYISNEAICRDTTSVLDLCSSWTSHINMNHNAIEDVSSSTASSLQRIAGLGMNAQELSQNSVLTEWTVQDLNKNPRLPYEDGSFDVALCQLSIDYLTSPLEVLHEVSRVLRPGGTVHILFSNRLFLSKAVALWTGADDIDHAYTVGCYLHFCDGSFQEIQAKDLSLRKGRDKKIAGDPLYVVSAKKILEK